MTRADRESMDRGVLANDVVVRAELDGRRAWLLRTRRTVVLLCLDDDDTLLLPYWGPGGHTDRIADYLVHTQGNRPSQQDFLDGRPVAYPVFGDPLFKEVCLVAARLDGSRETRLRFREDHLDLLDGSPMLELVFDDPLSGLQVTQRFRVFADHDVVARSTLITNAGEAVLVLERALCGALPLPPADYDAISLHGQWGREFGVQRRPLLPGKFVIESRRGLSSHEAHPWFAVRPRRERSEHSGATWFGALAWSGNWLCSLEVEANDAVHIVAGIQPFDFAWQLLPGDSFETPELVFGYSDYGLGGASRLMHHFEEEVWLPANHRDRERPVLYNSWEATGFDVRADQQIDLARRAASLGVELFVVDDGWFGARNHDRAGLGDWFVNEEKFPQGLRGLIDEVQRLGMAFGIWVEPEMVNPDSELFRAHADWAYHVDGREPTFGRNQLVLNLARDDVRSYLTDQLRRLLSDHGPIAFVKWDHNRAWTEVGWPEQRKRQREVWARHVFGVYDILRQLREEFPGVLFESCAGGGGRADLGMLRWTDQVWTSDNTDASDRLRIQYGFTRVHSPRVMVNWVTDVPNQQTGRTTPLEFRFHVAMQGVLGIGGNIARWSPSEVALARGMIREYKDVRAVVQFGEQYWLEPPSGNGPCAVQYVSRDREKTVLFMYQVRGPRGSGVRRVRLCGLDPKRRYRRTSDGAESTGATLMAAGVPATLVEPTASRPSLDCRSSYQVWHSLRP